MKMKMIALLIGLLFTLGAMGFVFSEEQKVKELRVIETKSIVTMIEGNRITVKNEQGKTAVLELKDVAGIKVGDKVTVGESKVTIIKDGKTRKQVPLKKVGVIEWN